MKVHLLIRNNMARKEEFLKEQIATVYTTLTFRAVQIKDHLMNPVITIINEDTKVIYII